MEEIMSMWKRRLALGIVALVVLSVIGAGFWLQSRYRVASELTVPTRAFSNQEYPEDPEARSRVFGNYPHSALTIRQVSGTRFHFLLHPGSDHATTIDLGEVDLAYFVAAVPPWVKADSDLTRVGLIDREWNRQQVQFSRQTGLIRVHSGGDGFEARALTRVDLARNCLNAGLWELLLFTVEENEEVVYEHLWFTFPLGLYKDLFESVNGLSYWDYWWSLEHWVDPSGTSIRLDRLRTIDREWVVTAHAAWDEAPVARGEQRMKRRNILSPPIHTYRDWYRQPVRFASFIPPGRYSLDHPRETQLHYLDEFTGARLRQIHTSASPEVLFELDLRFRDGQTGETTRIVIGGLDLASLPAAMPAQYERGWQVPFGIGNPSFFESYEYLVGNPSLKRPFYGFHLDAQDRWIDHHAIGVDGPLLHWDATDPSLLHLYLVSYERHALLNHFVIVCPREACGYGL
jgi:hypothetical protein